MPASILTPGKPVDPGQDQAFGKDCSHLKSEFTVTGGRELVKAGGEAKIIQAPYSQTQEVVLFCKE